MMRRLLDIKIAKIKHDYDKMDKVVKEITV
jgi:hypothetical protein